MKAFILLKEPSVLITEGIFEFIVYFLAFLKSIYQKTEVLGWLDMLTTPATALSLSGDYVLLT